MKKGFTLVEILLVISVIVFLSSMVVASTSAVRLKARNAYAASQIKEYQKAAVLYNTSFGEYPNPDDGQLGFRWYCLGQKPAGATYCSSPYSNALERPQLANDFALYLSSLPVATKKIINDYDILQGGASYACTQYSGGKCRRASFYWFMEGNSGGDSRACLVSGAYVSEQVTFNPSPLRGQLASVGDPPPATDDPYFLCELNLN